MDLYLIQGWSAPFFAAEFTAATATVKPENTRKNTERLAKGWAVRVVSPKVPTADLRRFACTCTVASKRSSRKTPRCVFANKNNNEVLHHAVDTASG
ncbi:hypothetical protein C1X30_04420 [Pseudomonas sp. FW305-BF6]|nr:hypothetical protein DBV33_07110 [Pseudomonas fluorescens]PNA07196.1 hypothetical protein C1X28_02810 [Pseudomonas sp. FW305-BF15]PNB82300.1 hypothetical protein C1X30_04420 [Pseudomonas sp. FW305-BF6]